LRLLQVCRLIAKKGLDVTLPAVGRLRDAGLPVRLTIAGSGAGEESLRQLTKRLGLEELVHFAGFVMGAALEDLFRESDVFVHPSRETERGDREGIPNSLLEAMSHGLPVVATRHSGIPEAVTDGRDGVLIDHAEPDALAAAIQRVVESRETYTRLSASARHTVETRFSIARCVAALEAAYHEAMALRA
jgi:colanic acid/amylovoran biosynthesis glycosyltransferase